MRERLVERVRRALYIFAVVFVLSPGMAYAADSSSSHYSVNQVQIGGNGSGQACNPGNTMCADQSVGDIVNGNACKTGGSYCAAFGSLTPDTPTLAVSVTGGIQNVGVLATDTTKTASFGVGVLTYLSGGYTLYITGAAPSNGSYHLKTMNPDAGSNSCPCTSQPGAEQFGINLARNTTPNVGADPVQVPDDTFSFGQVSGAITGGPYVHDYTSGNGPGHDDGGLFLYEDGDAIAGSIKSTGETNYTISMILNISGVTPAGRYAGTYSAVAVPVF